MQIHLAEQPLQGAQPGFIQAAGETGHAIAQAGESAAHSAMYLEHHLAAVEAHRQQEIKAASALGIQEGVTRGYQRIQDLIAQKEQEHRQSPVPSTKFYDDVNRGIADIIREEVRNIDPKQVGEEYAPYIQRGVAIGLLKHAETLSPTLRTIQTHLLKERNEGYLATRESLYTDALKSAETVAAVEANIQAMQWDFKDAQKAGFITEKDTVDRTEKYAAKAYNDWFERLLATDPDTAFRVALDGQKSGSAWFKNVAGKDALGLLDRVHKEKERRAQDEQHALDERRKDVGKKAWGLYFDGKPVPPSVMDEARLTLTIPEYKELKDKTSEREAQGGAGDDRMFLQRRQGLMTNPDRYSYTQIGAMRDLNFEQRKQLFETKNTWEGHLRAALNDPNHFLNDKSLKLYADRISEMLGVNKLSTVLTPKQVRVVAMAELDFWKQYETAYAAKKPLPPVEQVFRGVVDRYMPLMQQSFGGLGMEQIPMKPPTYMDVGRLTEDFNSGAISSEEFTQYARELRAWRDTQGANQIERDKFKTGKQKTGGGE